MFVGLISDTHGVFAEDVRKFLEPVDQIWHAGDFGTLSCAASIEAYKPLVGVHGNCDGQDVRQVYPRFTNFECEGLKVLMTHIGLRRGSYWAYDPKRPVYDELAIGLIDTYRPDVFVCGHTHIPQVFRDSRLGFLFMNPGACGYQGSRDVPRMALRFKIENGRISDLEKCELPWNK
ncbi:MAG: metallophosphoesterase family protein [Bacteroidales bacterium]|nr:metallophosphoesterase family protein [Bacteroidales bacterium]